MNNGRFKRGQAPWNKGLKHKEETVNKIKAARAKQIIGVSTRKKMSEAHSGHKHWNWQGGISKKKGYKKFYETRRKLKIKDIIGSHTYSEWEILKAQYDWTCPSCKEKEPMIKLTEDHIIPISKGGSDNIENIQPLCGVCNSKKYTKIIKYAK